MRDTTQTFMLHARPNPLCPWHPWNARHTGRATSPKKRVSRRSRFVSCVRTEVHMTACLFVLVCLHVSCTNNKNLGNERVTTFLSTQVDEACAHSWSKMVSRMTLRRFHMSWRYECACAHTKPTQITLQRGFLGLTAEQLDLPFREVLSPGFHLLQ